MKVLTDEQFEEILNSAEESCALHARFGEVTRRQFGGVCARLAEIAVDESLGELRRDLSASIDTLGQFQETYGALFKKIGADSARGRFSEIVSTDAIEAYIRRLPTVEGRTGKEQRLVDEGAREFAAHVRLLLRQDCSDEEER